MDEPFAPNQVKIAVIGGGTGSFTLLSALKDHTTQLAALVNMADDGGSTGVLRDELGALPPGDTRQMAPRMHSILPAGRQRRVGVSQQLPGGLTLPPEQLSLP